MPLFSILHLLFWSKIEYTFALSNMPATLRERGRLVLGKTLLDNGNLITPPPPPTLQLVINHTLCGKLVGNPCYCFPSVPSPFWSEIWFVSCTLNILQLGIVSKEAFFSFTVRSLLVYFRLFVVCLRKQTIIK